MNDWRTNARRRVGIVSADPLRVLGLKSILEEGAGFEGMPLTGQSALKTQGLDLVLLDESATEYVFELIAAFRRDLPNSRLLVLGPEASHEHIEQLIAAGVRGYLSYAASEGEVRLAVESVDEGCVWASRKVLTRLLDRPSGTVQRTAIHEVPKFTPREREVLHWLMMGYPNRNIGEALGVDEGTVKAHVGRLMRKVGVANRTALMMTVVEQRLR